MPKSRGRKPKKKRAPASAPKKRLDNLNATPQELPLSTQPQQEPPPLATAPRQQHEPQEQLAQIGGRASGVGRAGTSTPRALAVLSPESHVGVAASAN